MCSTYGKKHSSTLKNRSDCALTNVATTPKAADHLHGRNFPIMRADTMSGTFISSISVRGLHGRLDFDVNLKSGVNIIYGKNGLGKTTLLHIIANLSEGDIDIFKHLNFSSIEIVNSEGRMVSLQSVNNEISLKIDGDKTSYSGELSSLSEIEEESLFSITGRRSTYLPAFRSILERMRDPGYYSPEDRENSSQIEEMRRREIKALVGEIRSDLSARRRRAETARHNILKTIRCRQWFGSFVPVIRYPSIIDVIDGLTDEYEWAQLTISQMEQKQFENAFVDIFSAIAGGGTNSTVSGEEDGTESLSQSGLLDRIRELVTNDEETSIGPPANTTYTRLVGALQSTDSDNSSHNSLLQIYVRILEERRRNREVVMRPINAFQDSVNEFLNDKSLTISDVSIERSLPRRRISPHVSPDDGRPYNLKALSSGERQIVTMLYSASRSDFKAGCLLIDEPELSLHIDWQRNIISYLEKQFEGRQIIACTHSPEVGADHEANVQFFAPSIVQVDSNYSNSDIEDI